MEIRGSIIAIWGITPTELLFYFIFSINFIYIWVVNTWINKLEEKCIPKLCVARNYTRTPTISVPTLPCTPPYLLSNTLYHNGDCSVLSLHNHLPNRAILKGLRFFNPNPLPPYFYKHCSKQLSEISVYTRSGTYKKEIQESG